MQSRVVMSRPVVALRNGYPHQVAKWLAGLQIVLAFASLVFFVLAIVVGRTLAMLNVTVAIFFLINGILNLVSARTSAAGILVAVATSSVVAIVAALTFLYRASVSMPIQFHGFHILHVYVLWEVLEGILMLLCLIEGIISIVFLLLACQTLCNCCVTQVVILPSDLSKNNMSSSGTPATSGVNRQGTSPGVSNCATNYEIYLEERDHAPPDYKDVA